MSYMNKGGLVIEDGYWAAQQWSRRFPLSNGTPREFNAVAIRPYRHASSLTTSPKWTDWGVRIIASEMLSHIGGSR